MNTVRVGGLAILPRVLQQYLLVLLQSCSARFEAVSDHTEDRGQLDTDGFLYVQCHINGRRDFESDDEDDDDGDDEEPNKSLS